MNELMDILLSAGLWVSVLRIATPLIFGTLGALYCERAGVLNLGIEGIMTFGAMIDQVRCAPVQLVIVHPVTHLNRLPFHLQKPIPADSRDSYSGCPSGSYPSYFDSFQEVTGASCTALRLYTPDHGPLGAP